MISRIHRRLSWNLRGEMIAELGATWETFLMCRSGENSLVKNQRQPQPWVLFSHIQDVFFSPSPFPLLPPVLLFFLILSSFSSFSKDNLRPVVCGKSSVCAAWGSRL